MLQGSFILSDLKFLKFQKFKQNLRTLQRDFPSKTGPKYSSQGYYLDQSMGNGHPFYLRKGSSSG